MYRKYLFIIRSLQKNIHLVAQDDVNSFSSTSDISTLWISESSCSDWTPLVQELYSEPRREAVKTPDSAARWRAGQQRAGNVTIYNANLPERLVSAPVYTVRVWDRKLGPMIAGIRQHFRPA
jgi:hypothetical protein